VRRHAGRDLSALNAVRENLEEGIKKQRGQEDGTEGLAKWKTDTVPRRGCKHGLTLKGGTTKCL